MKTITFICYDNYPKTAKRSHIFKKRFSSLADVAKFLRVSNKIYLYHQMNEISRDELKILSMKIRSLNKMKVQLSWQSNCLLSNGSRVRISSPSPKYAPVVELADTLDLGSSAFRFKGSSPFRCTIYGGLAQLVEQLTYIQQVRRFESYILHHYLTKQFSWLECQPVTLEVVGSSPILVAIFGSVFQWEKASFARKRLRVRITSDPPFGSLAQLVRAAYS